MVCLFSVSRIFHLYGDFAIADNGLQNLGLCSALRAFLYRTTPAVTRGLGFPVSSEGPPHSVASYDPQGVVEDLF
jgi:hypothetical protein